MALTTPHRPRSPFDIAAELYDPKLARYTHDPAAFVRDMFIWRDGEGPVHYQYGNLEALESEKRVAVRGPHGLGKTAENSWAILWFALTREAECVNGGGDWKIPTTASVWRQLTKFLWPEIRKWARLLNWERIGRPPFSRRELQQQTLKLAHGEAFAVASDDPTAIEGAHADHMFYVFDEAKAINSETFDAAEGAFSGAGDGNALEAYALASSTPGEPSGRFYEIHTRKPGLEDWHPIHVTLDDTIKAGRVTTQWAEQRKRQWGAGSAVYHNRVLGEFYSSDTDVVIPLSWVEAANDRWRARFEDDEGEPTSPSLPNFSAVGVDVSREGGDRTVLALRYGLIITELREQPIASTMATTGVVVGILRGSGGHAVVDVVGVGGGVVDRLSEQGLPYVAFSSGARCDLVDRSGELGFADKRAAAWWTLRELLDPEFNSQVELPPDDRLTGDLTAPKWKVMSGGKIRVESKDDIHKRIGRSTDDGDAVVYAFWFEPPEIDEIVEQDESDRVHISRF